MGESIQKSLKKKKEKYLSVHPRDQQISENLTQENTTKASRNPLLFA